MTDATAAAMPEEGAAAPDFTLHDDTGAERHLSDRRGQWTVLYFYPKDDTPGCTTEACEFRDANREYGIRNAEVWGVSVLGTGSKARFKAKFGLPFVLLADEDHAVAAGVRNVGPEDRTTARPTWASSGPLSWSIRTAAWRAAGAACQARGPRSAGARRARRGTGPQRRRRHNEASPVGGDERCLVAEAYTVVTRAQPAPFGPLFMPNE